MTFCLGEFDKYFGAQKRFKKFLERRAIESVICYNIMARGGRSIVIKNFIALSSISKAILVRRNSTKQRNSV